MTTGIRMLATAVFFVFLAAITVQTALSFAAALERPKLYDYFDEALVSTPQTLSAVSWVLPDVPLDRPLEIDDAGVVGTLLTAAWASHAAALASGDTDYLPDHFSGIALDRARMSTADRNARMIVLHQDVEPVFFHRDGSVLQVKAEALTVRFLLDGGNLGTYRLTNDGTITTLLKASTGWRIFAHERRAAKELDLSRPSVAAVPLRGMNYYPAKTPWSKFWPNFNREIIARDFSLIRGLGGNAVRVFLHQDAFLNPVQSTKDLSNLQALLEEADAAGLQVVPTLFDMRGGFEPRKWANDFLWLKAILPVLASAPNVAFVDLKNEPNLDYAVHGKGLVQAWLRTMAAASRLIAPELPLTIGWSDAVSAVDMVDILDVVTYHDFLPPEGTVDRVAKVREVAGGKPVYVTEVGASSWSMVWGLPHSPVRQARLLQSQLDGTSGADGVFVWSLHDFPEPDSTAIGPSPWRLGLQSAFGLIAPDGTEKPAADIVRAAFRYAL